MAQQLLSRYGVLTREVAAAEGISGGFGAVYDVLKALEDAGRIRRGYFVGGVGATQFALPGRPRAAALARGAAGRARGRGARRDRPGQPVRHDPEMAATTAVSEAAGRGPTRTVGSLVVLVNGALAAYISRGARQLTVFLPEDEPARSATARALAARLAALAREDDSRAPAPHRRDQRRARVRTPAGRFLVDAGFSPSAMGFQMRRHA